MARMERNPNPAWTRNVDTIDPYSLESDDTFMEIFLEGPDDDDDDDDEEELGIRIGHVARASRRPPAQRTHKRPGALRDDD